MGDDVEGNRHNDQDTDGQLPPKYRAHGRFRSKQCCLHRTGSPSISITLNQTPSDSDLLEIDDARTYLAGMISGLDIAYGPSDGHPLAGRRAPDIDLTTADGTTILYEHLHHERTMLSSVSLSWCGSRLVLEPAIRAAGLRRSFILAALRVLHLAPPANTARLDGSTAEPRTQTGTESEGEPRRGSRDSPSTPRRHPTTPQEHTMNIDQIIATRFTDHPHQAPGDVPIDHPYRQRWWLPIIGPTSTCLLNHLATQGTNDDWHLTPTRTLATAIGLGKGTGKYSPLIRSLDRLTRFGFGHFDIEPSEQSDPCITLYRTIGIYHLASPATGPMASNKHTHTS